MENKMTIKLKDLLTENTIDDVKKWFGDNKKRISLKKFVGELNKIPKVKAEVADMKHSQTDWRSSSGGNLETRSKIKGIKIWYKGKHIFDSHTKSFDPIGNYGLVSNAIRRLESEME